MAKDWTGYQRYEPAWNDSQPVREVVRSELVGDVLVFPSGRSQLGGLHADVDGSLEPDVVADLESIPFKRNSFDTVYADPPYGMYWGNNDWSRELWRVAREKLILQTNSVRVHIPKAKKRYILIEPSPGSAKQWLRTIQVFEPREKPLDTF